MTTSTSPSPRLPRTPGSRLVGIAFVCLIHIIVISAVIQGLAYRPAPKPADTEMVLVKAALPPPPKAPEHKPIPKLDAPQAIPMPMTNLPVIAPPTIQTRPLETDSNANAQPGTDLASLSLSTVQDARAVCGKMSKPSVPAGNWTGDAIFRAVASTHAGRVNSVEIQAVSGGMPAGTQRAFKAAINSALRDGYECAGDVRFTQEFRFTIE